MSAWPTTAASGAQTRLVATLGLAQTLAWASSCYLPAVLAPAMARALGLAVPIVFLAFSLAQVVSALVVPAAGRAIDKLGGRPLLLASNGVFALGLGLLSLAQGLLTLFAAWAVLGLAMGGGLCEAAFATLVRLQGPAARSAITGITLIAGFASTVGWPLTAWMDAQIGWRGACLIWAGLHLLPGLPLNWRLPGLASAAPRPTLESIAAAPAIGALPSEPSPPAHPALLTALLGLSFAVNLFIGTAMATHLPQLLMASDATLAVAVRVGVLVAPAQLAAGLLAFGLLRRVHPLHSARRSAPAHPAGIAALLLLGRAAAAPFAFGLALDAWGGGALWLSGGLGLLAFLVLMALQRLKPS